MTLHNEAKKEEIAKIVLMPGDPLRAKYIAEVYLKETKLVNQIRNIFAYTGKYKGKEISIMASGMGMPSMGIYSYELFKFYNVDYIIRIGSCGAYKPNIDLLDIVLVENSYTEGNYYYQMTGENCNKISADKELNGLIEKTAQNIGIPCTRANMACVEFFDPYLEDPLMISKRLPKDENILGSEMETFALFANAKRLRKKASCLLTVSDSNYKSSKGLTVEDRQKAFNKMIELALETSIGIDN
ncbi:MAG: purine-nucleoside phosphorylase [Clostridia bacterium]|nr:purine-nucleoside phosphorylase [Clostridia bacterium]